MYTKQGVPLKLQPMIQDFITYRKLEDFRGIKGFNTLLSIIKTDCKVLLENSIRSTIKFEKQKDIFL